LFATDTRGPVRDEEGDRLTKKQAIDLKDITCLDVLFALEMYGVRTGI